MRHLRPVRRGYQEDDTGEAHDLAPPRHWLASVTLGRAVYQMSAVVWSANFGAANFVTSV